MSGQESQNVHFLRHINKYLLPASWVCFREVHGHTPEKSSNVEDQAGIVCARVKGNHKRLTVECPVHCAAKDKARLA